MGASLCIARRECGDLGIRPDRDDRVACDSHRLSPGFCIIERIDFAAVEITEMGKSALDKTALLSSASAIPGWNVQRLRRRARC
jgi:hypothetical protein